MDVLFLCHRLPYPPNKGDKIRSHALLTHLAKHHRVHLACFVDDADDWPHTKTVRELAGGECLFIPLKPFTKWVRAAGAFPSGQPITTAYFGSSQIKQWVGKLARERRIDRAVVFSSAMAPYVLNNANLDPARAILDMVDIDSDKWRQYAATTRGFERWIFQREASHLFRIERAAARAFGATLFVSQHEAQSFAASAPETAQRILALNNGVDLQRFKPGAFPNPFGAGEIPVVMTGRMDYRPNVDGAEWFAKDILPRVSRELPGVRFYVVGANPSASLRSLAGPRVTITGHVKDVRPYVQHAAAVVAPLRMARGVQNKVLEAMAMEKAVVATREATRSLSVTSGVDLWIENDPAAFATAVIAAARDNGRSAMVQSARRYVEQHHDWQQNLGLLDELLARLGGNSVSEDAVSRIVSGTIENEFAPRPPAKSVFVAGAGA